MELKDQWHKKTRETAMRALDKLENFRAKNLEIFRQKILGNCNGKINSSFLSSIFNGQDVHIYKYVSATFQNDAKSRSWLWLGNLLWRHCPLGLIGWLFRLLLLLHGICDGTNVFLRRWTNWLRFDGIRKIFKNSKALCHLSFLISKNISSIWNKLQIYCL